MGNLDISHSVISTPIAMPEMSLQNLIRTEHQENWPIKAGAGKSGRGGYKDALVLNVRSWCRNQFGEWKNSSMDNTGKHVYTRQWDEDAKWKRSSVTMPIIYLFKAFSISMVTKTDSAIVMGSGAWKMSQLTPLNIRGSAGHCIWCVCKGGPISRVMLLGTSLRKVSCPLLRLNSTN